MATNVQIQQFIKTLSALAIAEAKKRSRWVLPSVCIAQSALETGWGTSPLMTKANAYFGIKATSSWKGKVYNSSTKECYDGVTFADITACFRAYDSLAESVADYFDLITGASRYGAAVCNSDANSTITAIKNGGYATDPSYVTKVMNIINSYNLTQYDDVAKTAAGATETATTNAELKVGNIVNFTGAKHYTSANATSAKACKGGKAKVTAISQNGKHPYHLVNVAGGGSTVYGWVDAADIGVAETEDEKPWTPAVGDIVTYNGSTHYASANATAARSCKGGKAKITRIYQLGKSKHPYHLVNVSGGGATVYGWVDAGSFTKG